MNTSSTRFSTLNSVNIYLFKVSNRSSRKRCEKYSKLTIKTTERRQYRLVFVVFSGVFSNVSIIDFEQVIVCWEPVILCKTLNYYLPVGSNSIFKCWWYTNANLKICQCIRLHMKIICWRFHIKTPFTCWDMRMWDMCKVFYKHSETTEYVKN